MDERGDEISDCRPAIPDVEGRLGHAESESALKKLAAYRACRASADLRGIVELGDVFELAERVVGADDLKNTFLHLLVAASDPVSIDRLFALHRENAGHYEMAALASGPLRSNGRAGGHPFRLGFLSTDFREHSIAKFLLPLIRELDRRRFSINCYSLRAAPGDHVQAAIQVLSDKFVDCSTASTLTIASQIKEDEIDVLVELNGWTPGTRLEVLGYRPAPVQIGWLGYPFSTGMETADYMLLDSALKPTLPGLLSERPLELEGCSICFGAFEDVPIDLDLPSAKEGRVTFGTLNSPYKYSPECIASWAAVLRAMPRSRFLIAVPYPWPAFLRENLLDAFAANGVDERRIAVVGNEPNQHFGHYNCIDVTLDTFPLTGGTTTCDSLWMGVPVVSRHGVSMHQRLSHTILTSAGLSDLSTGSVEDFVRQAVAVAEDVNRRTALRRDLRNQLRTSPLCDVPSFARRFEAAMEKVICEIGTVR